jgi:hypothetical protein
VTPAAGAVHGYPDIPAPQVMTNRWVRADPDETITPTPDGEKFASDVRPVLESLAQSCEKDASHTTQTRPQRPMLNYPGRPCPSTAQLHAKPQVALLTDWLPVWLSDGKGSHPADPPAVQ